MRSFSGFASYFVAFELMMRQTNGPSAFYTLMAGGIAGTLSWLFTFPIDIVKSRLQVDGIDGKPKYNGAVDCLKQSYRAEGLNFFTRGLSSTLIRAFPMNAVCFLVVSYVMKFFDDSPKINVSLSPAEPLAITDAYQTSFATRVLSQTHFDSSKHKSTKYMICLDGFHEATCHADMMDLSDELREQRLADYFYRMSGIFSGNLTDDEMKTPLSLC